MAASSGVWGIDIGQCALKAVRLEVIGGKVTATAFDYVEHPKILSQPDADPDQLTREALEKFLERNPIRADHVAMSVPGQSGLARFVKLPPVEEKKVDDIVKFEARQQIPFPLDEVVWDFQKIGVGDVTDGFAIDTEIGLFAMKRDMINRFMSHFTGVGMEVHVVQMAPLALSNYITYDLLWQGGTDAVAGDAIPDMPAAPAGKKRCAVALDIGTDSSNLIITDGARIIWQRPIPLGGSHFTRALTKELKLTFAKAEHLKRNAAKSPELPQILKALKPVLNDFVGEVQRSLGYFTNTHRDAHIAYMIGLGSAFKLPGLQKYLGDKLSLEVRRVSKFQRLAGENVTAAPAFVENILAYPVAYGLALQGIGVSRLRTNLLPPEITFDRKIRAKKPWAVAAAAMIVVGTAAMALGFSMPYSAVHDELLVEQLKKDKQVQDRAKQVNNEVNASKQSVEAAKSEVQAIQSGLEERLNWIQINQIINAALPMPGGPPTGNMLDPDQIPLWNTTSGNESFKRYRDQMSQGLDPKKTIANDNRSALAMIDVYAIHCVYVPDLKVYYEKVREETKKELDLEFGGAEEIGGMTETDKATAPEGAGWAFEIRGSTWYDGKVANISTNTFIARTLNRNLRRIAKDGKPRVNAGPISHVFLWDVFTDKEPGARSFKKVPNSLVDYLAMASQMPAATPGMMPGPGMPAQPINPSMPGPGMTSGTGEPVIAPWVPLASGVSTGVGGPGGPGGEGMIFRPPVPRMDGPGGPGGVGSGSANPWSKRSATTTSTGTGGPGTGIGFPIAPMPETGPGTGVGPDGKPIVLPKSKTRPRFEFVVTFIWKESTPSDKYLAADAAAPVVAAPPPPPPMQMPK